jgi:hypothetical protein
MLRGRLRAAGAGSEDCDTRDVSFPAPTPRLPILPMASAMTARLRILVLDDRPEATAATLRLALNDAQ